MNLFSANISNYWISSC